MSSALKILLYPVGQYPEREETGLSLSYIVLLVILYIVELIKCFLKMCVKCVFICKIVLIQCFSFFFSY